MEKRVQCMKINNKNNIILYSIILLVYYIVFEFYNYKDIVVLKYISIIIIIVILVLSRKFYYKKKDVSVTSEELLNEYNKNVYESDKKYNEKYIKLTGVVSKIEITNKKDLYIFFESNNKFIILLTAFL
ncbi:OB-fold protein [Terrisporobacter petrolearius]|uniref:OB-fold protein n=1 Tax=Terrisporobacter petrolearius TaxID=1460447 RepID=UPI003B00F64F